MGKGAFRIYTSLRTKVQFSIGGRIGYRGIVSARQNDAPWYTARSLYIRVKMILRF